MPVEMPAENYFFLFALFAIGFYVFLQALKSLTKHNEWFRNKLAKACGWVFNIAEKPVGWSILVFAISIVSLMVLVGYIFET